MEHHFSKMNINASLKKLGRFDITFGSYIALSCKEVYREKKHKEIDIHSVKIRGKKIYIQSSHPIIASELLLLSEEIKKASLEKLKKMGIPYTNDFSFFFR